MGNPKRATSAAIIAQRIRREIKHSGQNKPWLNLKASPKNKVPGRGDIILPPQPGKINDGRMGSKGKELIFRQMEGKQPPPFLGKR